MEHTERGPVHRHHSPVRGTLGPLIDPAVSLPAVDEQNLQTQQQLFTSSRPEEDEGLEEEEEEEDGASLQSSSSRKHHSACKGTGLVLLFRVLLVTDR